MPSSFQGDETVAFVTSFSPEDLPAEQWLRVNRQSWAIENGLHQRLEVSLNDGWCRVRSTNGVWILGMFRRLANSLLIEWLSHQPNPSTNPQPISKPSWEKTTLLKPCAWLSQSTFSSENSFMHARCGNPFN